MASRKARSQRLTTIAESKPVKRVVARPPNAPSRGPLAAHLLKEQLAQSAAVLEGALVTRDLSPFYRAFRSTDLPFLGPLHSENPRGLFPACFEVLHRLGSLSSALALAIENHYFVTAALSTFPIQANQALEKRRKLLLRSITGRRSFVANTSSRIHTDKVESFGSQACREHGGFRVSGKAAFMSLATASDFIFFFAQVKDEGPAIFISPLPNEPGIEIGPLLFPDAMADSDTRRVIFHDLFLSEECVLPIDDLDEMARLGTFQNAWHQALLSIPFLGGAARAIEEARLFLRTVRGPNGQPLAELDGMAVDIGRLAIRYRTACCLVHQAGDALEALSSGSPTFSDFEDAFDLACAAKKVGMRCAEDTVGDVRRIIGARSLVPSHPLERLSQEAMFAPLGGEVEAFIDRRYGQRVLGELSFLANHW